MVKFNVSGGKDVWFFFDYFNFWVVNLGSGILGYVIFFGGDFVIDGVVCGY